MSRGTAAEKRYMDRVARLGCAVCNLLDLAEDGPVEIHHPREGQGMAQRAPNWLAIGLCPDHHRGPRGIHGDKGVLRQLKCDELDLLAWVISRLNT